MSSLTTHVLDTASGVPGSGLRVELYWIKDGRMQDGAGTLLASFVTNADGRSETPLLEGEAFRAGTYQLVFHLGDYFRGRGVPGGFLDVVPIRFSVDDPRQHYHVPLLCSPWSYTTYRGS